MCFADLVDSRKEAKELEVATKDMEKTESLQRRIFLLGTFIIIVATCVTTIFPHPNISKFGGFICSIAVLFIYYLFGLSIHHQRWIKKDKKKAQRAEAQEKGAIEASFVHIANYVA